MLSDDDGSEIEGATSNFQLTVNEHFAKAYAAKKEREELQKLKDKYGSDAEEDEDEDSEDTTEDEDGEELTPAMDAAILKTLAKIKNKDPEIYESGTNVFEAQHKSTSDIKKKRKEPKDKSKPLTLKQHTLHSVLNPNSRSPSPKLQAPTYAQEQAALRSETIALFKSAVKEGEDSDDDLLVPREKTKDEIEEEEEEYQEFLRREVGPVLSNLVTVEENVERIHEEDEGRTTTRKPKKSKKNKGEANKQETDQEFLMNYILNRGWIDRSAKRLPTYAEVTSSSKKSKKKSEKLQDDEKNLGDEELLDDIDKEEDFDDLAETFEQSYNFRFEEPGAATIATHPRNIASLVRRQDTTRKDAREKRKQRKEEEKQKRREEVNRLKALKMREIREKIEKIEKEGGSGIPQAALEELDLEGDWDPSQHDQQMANMYNEGEFYGQEDDEKPQWADDIDIDDIIPQAEDSKDVEKKKKKNKKRKRGDDEEEDDGGFGAVDESQMDADIEPADDEEWDGTEEMRKKKWDKYMDEIYELDFNDMIGDMPTRFKYAPVPADNFALTPAEILLATDKELNQYMSIKKMAPYKNKAQWERDRAQRLKELKEQIAGRSWDGVAVEELNSRHHREHRDAPKKKRKGRKEREKLKALANGANGDVDLVESTIPEPTTEPSKTIEPEVLERPAKKRKRKHKSQASDE